MAPLKYFCSVRTFAPGSVSNHYCHRNGQGRAFPASQVLKHASSTFFGDGASDRGTSSNLHLADTAAGEKRRAKTNGRIAERFPADGPNYPGMVIAAYSHASSADSYPVSSPAFPVPG